MYYNLQKENETDKMHKSEEDICEMEVISFGSNEGTQFGHSIFSKKCSFSLH